MVTATGCQPPGGGALLALFGGFLRPFYGGSCDDLCINVVRLRFPEEQPRLGPLRSLAIPRLLLVADGTAPPTCPDPFEDWIWASASEVDRCQRAAALELRASCRK